MTLIWSLLIFKASFSFFSFICLMLLGKLKGIWGILTWGCSDCSLPCLGWWHFILPITWAKNLMYFVTTLFLSHLMSIAWESSFICEATHHFSAPLLVCLCIKLLSFLVPIVILSLFNLFPKIQPQSDL